MSRVDNLYITLAQTFGPLIQAISFFFIFFLGAGSIYAVAFWGERKLIRTGNHTLWRIPFPVFIVGLLYGGLRFSGLLLYAEDGWDQWGHWNFTNQNSGAFVLFVCGCLLIGAFTAIFKEKADKGKAGL